MKMITIEEHLSGAPIDDVLGKYLAKDAPYSTMAHVCGRPYTPTLRMLRDMDQSRIEDMDENGITMQILSCPSKSQLLPAGKAADVVKKSNDYIANVVNKHPKRYGAFALLPWSNPDAAVREVERISQMGFKGILIAGRASGGVAFLDDKQYGQILKTCETHHMPVYIHPGAPLYDVHRAYYAGLGDEVSARLSLHGWGWHNEAGIQIIRMILAGIFDTFPTLQLIAGHWGEMVPFFLSRLDQSMPREVTGLNRTITEYFRNHVYVTPSGIFDYPQLQFCVEVLGADRIMHSVDCPFIGNEGAVPFIQNAPISEAEKEMIAYKNAVDLFDLQ